MHGALVGGFAVIRFVVAEVGLPWRSAMHSDEACPATRCRAVAVARKARGNVLHTDEAPWIVIQ
jgi:hypothetical protein